MKARLIYAAALFTFAASPAFGQGVASDEAVAAIALPEPQLRKMLAGLIFTTQTIAVANYTLGIPEACAVIKPSFEKAVGQVLPEWRNNLVAAYRENVPAKTLTDATAAGPIAGAEILLPYLSNIGARMERDSKPLLMKAGEAVLLPVFDASARHNAAKVDGDKRMAEMKRAKADGSLFCGIQPIPMGTN